MMKGTAMIDFRPIGIIKSPVTKMSQGNWGQVQSQIHLYEEYTDGLKGLEEFSHVLVVFYMHEAHFSPSEHLLRRPRSQASLPEVGVFAQRSKYRPNPIGVTSVRLEKIERNVLTVLALDALNNTPVLDIKPYLPMFDRIEEVRLPAWIAEFEKGYF
jgi:tRNA-Thr(GGU) m(6)t(6)A37 methyltransferase TsaA